MYHAHAGHQLEQLARHVGPGPASGRRHIELVGIGLGVGDQFETRRDRNRRMHLHDQSGAADASDRCNVTEEIEREILEEGRVDRAARRDHDERIASGGDRTTDSMAILPLAPGRLSMMNCWPSRSDSHWPMRRALMSFCPPGAKPTTMRTGRVG